MGRNVLHRPVLLLRIVGRISARRSRSRRLEGVSPLQTH